jgi:phosphatidate cytidylyltransferase
MSDLTRRLIVGPIVAGGVAAVIYFAHHPIFQYVAALAIALLAGIAVWEYEQLVKAKGAKVSALIAITVLGVLSFVIGMQLIVFLAGALLLFAFHFKEKEGAILDLAASYFGLLYIAVPMGMMLSVLFLPDGRFWVAYLLIVTKITDVGAYFGGNFLGKHRLAPMISPKKTVEGAIVGLLCAIGASFALYTLHGDFPWLILGAILGLVGQFGDLAESLLKRDANKKDSNALPGLGGVLDMLDSILFNAVIIYIYDYYY